jgi:hypothetical protein
MRINFFEAIHYLTILLPNSTKPHQILHPPPNQQNPGEQVSSNKQIFSPSGTVSTDSSRCTAHPESTPGFSPCLTAGFFLPTPSEYTVATAPHKNTTKTGVATLLNP